MNICVILPCLLNPKKDACFLFRLIDKEDKVKDKYLVVLAPKIIQNSQGLISWSQDKIVTICS